MRGTAEAALPPVSAACTERGRSGRPALGVFTMCSWREPGYYQCDPWRGQWDTEGGGVLVNQSPPQLDLLRWFMGPVGEVSGYWANVNHPGVEVDDTAVAVLRFHNGGLGALGTGVGHNPGHQPIVPAPRARGALRA